MMSDKLRFAVLGCGHIGTRHINSIRAHKGCELVALCDTKPLQTAIAETSIPFFDNDDDLFNENFDVLCVATPNGLHEQHALKGLKQQRHVLIEKPMSLTAASCQRIIEEAKKQKREVFCVMQNRYSAPSKWLKELMQSKILGDVFFVTVNCFWNRDNRYYKKESWRGSKDLDGGTLFTQFSHFIDSLLWLFGDIENITTRFQNFSHRQVIDFEDSGSIQFNFQNGAIGNFNYTTSVPDENMESNITVIAEKGVVKISGQYMDRLEICKIPGGQVPLFAKQDRPSPQQMMETNYSFLFDNIVCVLKYNGQKDIDPLEAYKVVAIIEKIYSGKKEI